jgi:hypothetical protein
MSAIRDQLARLEGKVDRVVADVAAVKNEVDTLRRKASFWGVVGGFLATLATGLVGCIH